MKYSDFNLKKLREDNDLDFAHYTYVNNYCSCCYGPSDFPSLYWKNREVINESDERYKKINYILFKNSGNGSGQVTKNDGVDDFVYIGYSFKDNEMLNNVCKGLLEQVKEYGYGVMVPKNESSCIVLVNLKFENNELNERDVNLMIKEDGYRLLS